MPTLFSELRKLLEAEKIREVTLLEVLVKMGSVPDGAKSLEEAELKKPGVLKLVQALWSDLSKNIKAEYGANA